MNSACTWWVLARQIVSVLSINSTQTHWVNAPSPPVLSVSFEIFSWIVGCRHFSKDLRRVCGFSVRDLICAVHICFSSSSPIFWISALTDLFFSSLVGITYLPLPMGGGGSHDSDTHDVIVGGYWCWLNLPVQALVEEFFFHVDSV